MSLSFSNLAVPNRESSSFPFPSTSASFSSQNHLHTSAVPSLPDSPLHRPSMSSRASTAYRRSIQSEEGTLTSSSSANSPHNGPKEGSHSDTQGRPQVLQQGSMLLHQGSVVVKRSAQVVVRELFLDIRNDSIAMAGEFVGTVLFLLLSLGAVQTVSENLTDGNDSSNPKGNSATQLIGNYYRASAFGFALYATSSIFYRFTGSIFNPSVSLALALVGVVRPVRFFLVCFAQMAGGIAACFILSALLPGSSNINLALGANTSPVRGLFIEMFASMSLVLNVLMLGAEKHLVTPHAPLGFGLTLFAIVLFSVEYTGTGINVARAFGAACVEGFQSYHWIYWLGPTLGALIAVAFYLFLKAVRYWQINPGQDATQPLLADKIADKVGPVHPGAEDNPRH